MNEFKGTPGTWLSVDGTIMHEGKRVGAFDIITEDSKPIGCAYPYDGRFPSREQAEANAKLFAAAPDMLTAIECALNIKDLWAAQQHGTISADHAGEMEALKAMQDKLESAYKKATT